VIDAASPKQEPAQPGNGATDAQPKPGPTPPRAALLEFELKPEDAARILRAPTLAAHRTGRPRTSTLTTIWHDSPSGDLFDRGLSLGKTRDVWRLEALVPDAAPIWHPATPAPVLAEAASIEGLPASMLGRPVPNVVPIAAFTARVREIPLVIEGLPALLTVLDGTMRGVAQDRPACRLVLSGDLPAMTRLAANLAGDLPLQVPLAGLAAQALAVARGTDPAPRRLGTPCLHTNTSVGAALTTILAHLADVILYWASLVPRAASPEPVHQMRVAVRRLRSALAVFRRAVRDDTIWLDDLAVQLKALAGALGAARDWDVFLGETGEAVRQAFPSDARIERLVAAARRKRATAYADLGIVLASPEWHRLALSLALLPSRRPWAGTPEPSAHLAADAGGYAANGLDRRLKHVLEPGSDLSGLPIEKLHDIRKQAKALRYAIEFFAPLFPEKAVRKYLPKLEELQEDFGALNDAAVIVKLMESLGNGPHHAFAAGVMQGFGAASTLRAARRLHRAWPKFYRATPFWD